MPHRPIARLLESLALAVGLMACRPTTAPAPASVAAEPGETVSDVLAASDLPDVLAQPLPGDPLGVTIHRLENGLTVYLSTVRDQPRVA